MVRTLAFRPEYPGSNLGMIDLSVRLLFDAIDLVGMQSLRLVSFGNCLKAMPRVDQLGWNCSKAVEAVSVLTLLKMLIIAVLSLRNSY